MCEWVMAHVRISHVTYVSRVTQTEEARLHSYVCYDSFVCVLWLTRMCVINHSYVRYDSFVCVPWLIRNESCHTCGRGASSIVCVLWLARMCAMTLISMCAMPHSYMCHDSFGMSHVTHTKEARLLWKKRVLPGVATISRLLQKIKVSCAKEPYKRDYILQKRPIISRSLLFEATPYLQYQLPVAFRV